jgi:hypothetical protein
MIWAFVEAAWVSVGCSAYFGDLQTQASPWQETQHRHSGHGASDGANHLAALDAAPGLHERF